MKEDLKNVMLSLVGPPNGPSSSCMHPNKSKKKTTMDQ